jgi:hypothetical protein
MRMASVADLVEPLIAGDALPPALVEQARDLYESGAVRLDAFGPLRVTAAVDDRGICRVELEAAEGHLRCSCACDGDEGPCIHILATALETWHRAPKRRS